MSDFYLQISHHEDALSGKSGFLIEHVRPGPPLSGFMGADSVTYADYEPQDFHPHFAEWPKSLWGYFESREAAEAAIKTAGLSDAYERSKISPRERWADRIDRLAGVNSPLPT